jgi:iron complex transport system ATP-binding protein
MTMANTAQLTATALSVGFDKRVIAAGIEVSVEPGEIVALAGPNGVGKSTVVKALARQLKPLSGTVALGGKDVWQLSASEFAAKVAYVPQSLEPGQDFTVEEMVMLGRNPHQKWWQWYGTQSDKDAVEIALEATQMLPHRKHYISQLSGGERQRACMATALAQEPTLLILDEPTSHLDFRHQLDLLAQLKTLRERSIGCLVVLHDLNLMARIADRIVLLRNGPEAQPSSIAASGSPSSVLSQANLADVFNVDVHIFNDPISGEPVYNPTRPVG